MRIKEVLKEKGIKAGELATKLGITDAALSQSITGNPKLDRLQQIADALNVDITELFQAKNEKKMYCPHCGKAIDIHIE